MATVIITFQELHGLVQSLRSLIQAKGPGKLTLTIARIAQAVDVEIKAFAAAQQALVDAHGLKEGDTITPEYASEYEDMMAEEVELECPLLSAEALESLEGVSAADLLGIMPFIIKED